jgi:hypothetical protein
MKMTDRIMLSRKSKVGNLENAILEQDVFGFDVAMDDIPFA